MKNQFNQKLFDQMPVVGIMRNISQNAVDSIVPIYEKSGFGTLEITLNTVNATGEISRLVAQYPNLNIGAGTVCTISDLQKALEAGASFIVSPILDMEVMAYCVQHDIPIFPGALTPLEIYTAWQAGATAVKVFPATQLGPGYIKDVLAPLNEIRLLPTGGVTLENIAEFFRAGSTGVGMGSTLFDDHLIEKNDYDGLYRHFQNIAQLVLQNRVLT